MNSKTISLAILFGVVVFLASCSKNDSPDNTTPIDPNPTDTTKTDTTSTNPKDTTTTHTGLSFPTTFVFKNTVVPDMEYYQIMNSGTLKVNEPYYMRYAKNLLQLAVIKDDYTFPFQEIQVTSSDKLTMIYKDGTVIANNTYSVQNNSDLYIQSSGYLGSFNADKSLFYLNLCPYSYSNSSNRPIYPRLSISVCSSPDKNKTMNSLITAQSLEAGDTLAINFTQMVYEKK